AAVPEDTPAVPLGAWVLPGEYRVQLGVNGATYSQPLAVKLDPRVKTAAAALESQLALSLGLTQSLGRVHEALAQARALREQIAERRKAKDAPQAALLALDQKLAALVGSEQRGPGRGAEAPSLNRLAGELASLYEILQGSDAGPTSQAQAAADDL